MPLRILDLRDKPYHRIFRQVFQSIFQIQPNDQRDHLKSDIHVQPYVRDPLEFMFGVMHDAESDQDVTLVASLIIVAL